MGLKNLSGIRLHKPCKLWEILQIVFLVAVITKFSAKKLHDMIYTSKRTPVSLRDIGEEHKLSNRKKEK